MEICKYRLVVNIDIEGCDTIRIIGYFIHVHAPYLIQGLNLDTCITLVKKEHKKQELIGY